MLVAHEIRPVAIKVDEGGKTVAFEVQGWRNYALFSISGRFPVSETADPDKSAGDVVAALKMLLRDVANTL